MATIAAKAARRAHVNARLAEQSEQLAATFGIEIPTVPGTTRDPELDQIVALERVSAIFESVLGNADTTAFEPQDSMDVVMLSRPYNAEEFADEYKLDQLKQIAALMGVDAEVLKPMRAKVDVANAIGERIHAEDFLGMAFGIGDDGEIIPLTDTDELQANEPDRVVANPEFRDMTREDLEKVATEWYDLDPAEYADDEALRLALVAAYEAETSSTSDPDGEKPGEDDVLASVEGEG